MKKVFLLLILAALSVVGFNNSGDSIMEKVDKNMSSRNRIVQASMTINGRRSSRTITSKSWSEGTQKSFTEYLSPASEQGTKMLKTDRQLWIYSPSTDRIIQISGNMLRQSVMGSDMSYEDMMDDRKMTELYTERLLGNDTVDGRNTYLVQLSAKVQDVAYASQKVWVDAEKYVPLKQELYARSGQLLKQIKYSDVRRIQGRWFPCTFVYKDMLKDGRGTEVRITSIQFDQVIPPYIFSKAALKQ
jgi:outer membrane lipoprotein-sorting protein